MPDASVGLSKPRSDIVASHIILPTVVEMLATPPMIEGTHIIPTIRLLCRSVRRGS